MTPTTVAVAANDSATIQYRVTNQSRKTHTLAMQSISSVSQTTTTGNCPYIFTLRHLQSCVLTLEINGSQLQETINGGPIVCESGNRLQCYQPNAADLLNVSRTNGTAETTTALIASGAYSNGTTIRPLLALSIDSGTTWTYSSSINEVTFTPDNTTNPFVSNGRLRDVSCSSAVCIAAGDYQDSSTHRPFIATSQDSGSTWTYPSSANEMIFTPDNTTHPFVSNAYVDAANCTGTTCISTGPYGDGATRRPFAGLSQDSGSTWTFPSSANELIFTPDNTTNPFANTGVPTSCSCSGATCMLSGSYRDTANTQRPFIATSQDSGTTWTYPSSVNEVTFTPDNTTYPFANGGRLNGASCSENVCIAVGSYSDGTTRRPFIAVSQDSASTWTYPSSVNEVIFTPDNTTHPFSEAYYATAHASCFGTLCIAANSYSDGTTYRPFIAVSQDSGSTWTYPSSANEVIFTPDNTTHPFVSNAFVDAANCTGTTCTVSGSYSDGTTSRPLLALSIDSGTTWTYPSSINEVTFTPDNTTNPFVSNGRLFGTGGTE